MTKERTESNPVAVVGDAYCKLVERVLQFTGDLCDDNRYLMAAVLGIASKRMDSTIHYMFVNQSMAAERETVKQAIETQPPLPLPEPKP